MILNVIDRRDDTVDGLVDMRGGGVPQIQNRMILLFRIHIMMSSI